MIIANHLKKIPLSKIREATSSDDLTKYDRIIKVSDTEAYLVAAPIGLSIASGLSLPLLWATRGQPSLIGLLYPLCLAVLLPLSSVNIAYGKEEMNAHTQGSLDAIMFLLGLCAVAGFLRLLKYKTTVSDISRMAHFGALSLVLFHAVTLAGISAILWGVDNVWTEGLTMGWLSKNVIPGPIALICALVSFMLALQIRYPKAGT